MKPVPNQMPASDPGAIRMALVGEAPGADEVALGYPFAGKSGWLLNQWLASAGVNRSQVFTGNVCQMKPSPASNDFHLFEWSGPRVQEGIAALREDLARFHPNIVVALGNAALHLLRHGNAGPPKSQKLRLFQWTSHVGTWRGSLFLGAASFDPFEAADLRLREGRCPVAGAFDILCSRQPAGTQEDATTGGVCPDQAREKWVAPKPVESRSLAFLSADCGAAAFDALSPESPCPGSAALSTSPACTLNVDRAANPSPQGERGNQSVMMTWKCLSTYHPAATFREPSFTFPLVSDLKRAVEEARSPLLELPPRNIRWGLPIDELEARCAAIRTARAPVGFDIEGGLRGLQCASFATSPSEAFVVDLMGECLERPRMLAALVAVLEDEAVPKVLWNAAYERAILHAVAGVTLRRYEDGMLAWWERFSELPKGLDFVASILTREPYWAQGIGWDKRTGAPRVTGPRFWTYNALDAMLALEIWQHPLIRAAAESHAPVPFAAGAA